MSTFLHINLVDIYGFACLGCGVRSDAQLSCTDTRFQKCSQSGKNGSKNPMLFISMAYNAIPYKKSKITDESKLCFRAKKSPKIPQKNFALNRDLLKKNYRYMVYFRCYLVNPHVQAVQIMCGKLE